MSHRRLLKVVAVMATLTLVAAACGRGKEEGKKGGSIVIAAEQWPDCLNTITACANASWLGWSVLNYILPQLMEFDDKGNFVPSPVITGTPTLEETPKFRLTYRIDPDAVWDDGTPITGDDVEFTRKATLETTGTLSKVGYEKIESIESQGADKKTVVITFKEVFADWPDLFGGNQRYILKKAAFTGTNLKDEMADNVAFSGGPWKLKSWSKTEAVLIRNDKYWEEDRVPLLDQVTLVPRTDQDTEINSLLSGEVVAIFPQPAPGFADRLEADPAVKFVTGASVVFEGLWFNLRAAPVSDKAVREALFYAVDRQAILETVIKKIVPGVPLLNCAGWVPGIGEWCDQTDFADFTYDPDKSKQILQAAGWTLGGDGIFAKGGKKLSITWSTVTGNKRREDTQVLVQAQAKAAGIDLKIRNFDADTLFQKKLPKLDFVMAEYAQVASPDPTVTTIYHCDNIPSKANDFQGQNASAWCNEAASALMKQSDQTVDTQKRLGLIRQIGDAVRQDLVWLPLYPLPSVTAWRTDRIVGPVGSFTSSPPGGFWNIYDWSEK